MNTRRLVLGAVTAFVVVWTAMVGLALRARSGGDAPVPVPPPEPPAPRGLTLADVAHHATPEDCWIVVRGRVYDVSVYISAHPAARSTITEQCGRESTAAFETKGPRGRPHSARAWELLEAYFVDELTER